MEEFQVYEYVVAPKKEGKYLMKRILMICGYIAVVLGLIAVLAANPAFTPVFALSLVFMCIIVFFTWRYVSVEYEYSMVSGEVTFSEIYGGRSRRQILSFRLKDCTMIAPAQDRMQKEKAELYGATQSYSALTTPTSPDAYFATFENEKKEKCIVYFEATEKALKICRFYNPAATVVTKVSR